MDQLRQDVIDRDLDFRNRLIEIFGTPYEGTIGTGKPYPAGYTGPDLSLYMYVDVREISSETVPPPSADYTRRLLAFRNDLNLTDKSNDAGLAATVRNNFLNSLTSNMVSWTSVVLSDDSRARSQASRPRPAATRSRRCRSGAPAMLPAGCSSSSRRWFRPKPISPMPLATMTC